MTAGLVLLGLLSTGCGDPRPEEARSVDTASPAAADTATAAASEIPAARPSARFELPLDHNSAPYLYLTMPGGYQVHEKGGKNRDQYIINADRDPSLRDSTAITPGFLQIYVGRKEQSAVEPGMNYEERNVVIDGHPLTWKMWREPLPDGAPYYAREITTTDFFAGVSPELARAGLHLHIYVAGADSAQVAELMTAVQTMSLTP